MLSVWQIIFKVWSVLPSLDIDSYDQVIFHIYDLLTSKWQIFSVKKKQQKQNMSLLHDDVTNKLQTINLEIHWLILRFNLS